MGRGEAGPRGLPAWDATAAHALAVSGSDPRWQLSALEALGVALSLQPWETAHAQPQQRNTRCPCAWDPQQTDAQLGKRGDSPR